MTMYVWFSFVIVEQNVGQRFVVSVVGNTVYSDHVFYFVTLLSVGQIFPSTV